MGDIVLLAPGEAEVDELDRDMRAADRAEIVAASGPDTRRTIERAVRLSPEPIAIRETRTGDLLCILGTVPLSAVTGRGCPWMLGTDGLDRHPRTLMRVARRYFDEVARVYSVLENYVDARHTASITLLEWLGCSFDPPAPFGQAGLPFMRFERRSA